MWYLLLLGTVLVTMFKYSFRTDYAVCDIFTVEPLKCVGVVFRNLVCLPDMELVFQKIFLY